LADVLTLDEERGIEMMITFKAARTLSNWKEIAAKRLTDALVRDGCQPESIFVDSPFEAVDDNGVSLDAWRIQAVGFRRKESVDAQA